jgi:hypothetical protein
MSENILGVSQQVESNFEEIFEKEREKWSDKIKELAIKMKNIHDVAEAQIDLFSTRQIVTERSHKVGQILSKLNSEYRTRKGERMVHYSTGVQTRYGTNEKTHLIESDLSALKYRMDLLDNHMSFLNETIKSTDHMLYGIRQRIDLENYLREGFVK